MNLDPPTDLTGDALAMRDQLREVSGCLDGFGDPGNREAMLALLRLLYETGRRDLPLGRLFEGHVDALQIITRYAEPTVASEIVAKVRGGATFGVWNADLPGETLHRDDYGMTGGKSFASGAGILKHALVTIDAPGGRQLLLVDLEAAPPVVDREWWRVIGMERSRTHIVRWSNASSQAFVAIGQPGDYVREPWFSGGALRFVSVQAGGIAALCDHVRDHLVATGRDAEPHQMGRLAALFDLADSAASVVRVAACAWFDDPAARLARVAAARVHVSAAADAALTIAQQAVGLAGMFDAHPLSAVLTNLMVYLRQPAPDAQRMAVGAAVADRRLVPGL